MENEPKANDAAQNPDEVRGTDDGAQIEREKTISELTIDAMKNIDFLIIPKREKDVCLIYNAYKTSEDTLKLLSEQNRTVFSEIFLFEIPPGVKKLYWMTLELVAANFSGNAKEIEDNFDEVTQQNIWELVDVKIPIKHTIDINNDSYWKRVFESCTKRRFQPGQDQITGTNLNWKCVGLSERIREIFEEQSVEGWIDEEMIELVKPIAQYIYVLRFTKLLPIKEYTFDRDPNLLDYHMINYDKEECHHINIAIVGELYKLKYLSFEFVPPKLGFDYQSRYFDFSTLDMIHLASGLKRLENLTTFKLRNSRMNSKKLELLADAFKSCPLKHIDFSYCQLNDECGFILCKLFEQNKQLEAMNICGNYICSAGMSSISYGIQQFEGYLKYLNISRNPINDTGFLFLARAMHAAHQIENLNICGIHITTKGCVALSNILQNKRLININMIGLPIGEILGDEIINSIDSNKNLLKCEADDCDLTIEQELKIKILIDRNNYIYKNPYIGIEITDSKQNVPEEEVGKIKNEIYLKALELSKHQEECAEILNKAYKKNLPKINTQSQRYSVQVNELMTQELKPANPDKQKRVRLSNPEYFQRGDDPELEFAKHCVLAKTTERGYF